MDLYQDIAQRTQGDIYIGVVGPVRTGKSTFIKKFMDTLVVPNIEDEAKRERAVDELPQSAKGRTIMTTEPKFVPNEAVQISLGDNALLRVRMVDCVGYVVENAAGYMEEGAPRMVRTPWFSEEIPFAQAAEIGTKKVITEHSTIGIAITTDGSITELAREDYLDAERRVISELQSMNKPFILLLNSVHPEGTETIALAGRMEEEYGVPVMPVNCAELTEGEITDILERILYEFPLTEMEIAMPAWLHALSPDHWLRSSLLQSVKEAAADVSRIRETRGVADAIAGNEYVQGVDMRRIDLSCGRVSMQVDTADGLYYRVISELSGLEIEDDDRLMSMMIEMGQIKREYDKIAPAIREVKERGYGIVSPTIDELSLEEPEIVRQGSRYGVRLRASAPSIHMIRADIETEVSPIVGTERQSEELIEYLLHDFNEDKTQIWKSNIFGKSLNELVNEGLRGKLEKMPSEAQDKLQETLQRIINEGSGGLICIIL